MPAARKQRVLETPRRLDEQVDAMVCAFSDATDGKVPGDYSHTPRSALTRRMRGIVGGSLVDVRRKLTTAIERLNAIRLATLHPLAPANLARLQKAGEVLDDSGDLADVLNALAFIGDALAERDKLAEVQQKALDERKRRTEDRALQQSPEVQRQSTIRWFEFIFSQKEQKAGAAYLTDDDRRMLVEKFAAAISAKQ